MTNEQHNVQIRNASLQDVDLLTDIEAACFPAAEAAPERPLPNWLRYYARHFWIIEVNGTASGFIDGFVTNQKTITDNMFEDASLHNPQGDYQAVFGLNVLPAYRRNGYAAMLMQAICIGAKLCHAYKSINFSQKSCCFHSRGW